MTKVVAPSVKLKAFNCPRCGAFADQSWFDGFVHWVKDTPVIADEETMERIKNIPKSDNEKVKEKYDAFMAAMRRLDLQHRVTRNPKPMVPMAALPICWTTGKLILIPPANCFLANRRTRMNSCELHWTATPRSTS